MITDDPSSYLIDDYEGLDSAFSEITELASTGYCSLYKAKRDGRWFLLKCLKTEVADDPAFQQLLRKEFEILMQLQHPAVMQAVGMESVALPQGELRPCIVAEWIDGLTLADFLQGHPPLQVRRRIVKELVEAVAYIHSQQIVHRDLKPSNIMITHNGNYGKIVDFGLADTDSHAILKQPAGTQRYMSPEQARMAEPDIRNDIYSLGIIMQEMDLGSRYNKMIARCLKPIDQRYQHTAELQDDIRSGKHRRHRLLTVLSVVVAVIIAILVSQIYQLREKTILLESNSATLDRQLKVLNHEIIDFEDLEAKSLCIRHWDSDRDGELSYTEAASVKSLSNVFTQDTLLHSFNELEHFTGLCDIGMNAFWGCSRLESVRIPRTVRYIRQNAFRCTALEMITIPSSVAAMGDHALEDCPRLETVIFESVLPNTNIGSLPIANCPRLSGHLRVSIQPDTRG